MFGLSFSLLLSLLFSSLFAAAISCKTKNKSRQNLITHVNNTMKIVITLYFKPVMDYNNQNITGIFSS